MSTDAHARLLTMGLLEDDAVGQPMCEDCFSEFREILIDSEADGALMSLAPTVRAAIAGDTIDEALPQPLVA